MKNLRLLGFATIAALASGTLLLAACSDDTSVPPPADGGPGTDARTDGTTGDGSDTDSGDAGIDSATFDAGLKVDTFAAAVSNAMCNTLSRCCYGAAGLDAGAPVDGGTFDRGRCTDVYAKAGFESSLVGFEGAASAAEIDQLAGFNCLEKIKTLTCNLGGAEFQSVRAECFKAIKGKNGPGATCKRGVDCAPGNFCDSRDGGPGVCATLKSAGGACGTFDTGSEEFDFAFSDEACSWRASGDTKLFCLQGPLDGGPVLPKDEWKCAAARPDGQECANSLWCGAGICNFETSKCTSPLGVFPQSYCGTFVNP